ncbi:FAD-binding oxidoreductase [Paracoccus methylarcula]|uniref:FAD-binding oxidoreductase n=1 Tax=Paracoccus methylarcula TaxID=72022 RepID=A0A422QTH4_9RHOB|nr:FAD-binding oxidoreductase [Paracoccus methylarcula]RNF33299.1 FAD-binding oxidoreductase [Paracoccus methylarcula]
MLEELRAALGPVGCLTGDDIPEAARSDASRTGQALPLALLRPASVREVSAALAICHHHRLSVVPQGGMTGLAGGANPDPASVALSLERLSGIEEIDAEGMAMVVRAGTVLEHAQLAAQEAGFLLPVDLGARGSCQIGGNIATNAGGLRVIRDGMTRDNLLGIEVVLADGTVLGQLSKVVKNNTGYDLRHLFAGSEGTLGIITRAVIRLRPLPAPPRTALAALPDFAAVLKFLQMAREALPGLSAFEAMWRDYFAFSQNLLPYTLFDTPPPFAIILEAPDDPAFDMLLERAFDEGLVTDALIARSLADARRFWTLREGVAMDAALPGLINLDISLATRRLDEFACRCRADLLARFPGAHVSFFGHIADSNLHVAVCLPGDDNTAQIHDVDAIVYGLVREFGGSISAEHGVGTLKRDWLGHSRSEAEIAAMRAIKAALDPRGIMNPGKLLPI